MQTVELVPNGAGILVTRANVGEYVDKYVVRKLKWRTGKRVIV